MESDNFLLLISPLNNIYAYDMTYLSCKSHVDRYQELCSQEAISSLSSNEYLAKHIALLPYIQKEFLQYMKDKGISRCIKHLVRTMDEVDVVKAEHLIMNLDLYFSFDYVLLDEIPTDKDVVIILEDAEDLLKTTTNTHTHTRIFPIVNTLIFNENKDYLALQEKNVAILKNNPNLCDLIIESLRQANNYIEHVYTQSTGLLHFSKEEIHDSFFSGCINVVYIFDSKSSAKNYRKRELAQSSKGKVNYIPFVNKNFGVDEALSSYPKFDVFLQRCPYLYFDRPGICNEVQRILDLNEHKDKVVLHRMGVIDQLFYRYEVYQVLRNFIERLKDEAEGNLHITLSVPESFKFEYSNEADSSENLLRLQAQIENHCYVYPFIIKPDSCTEHKMFLIINQAGLEKLFTVDNIPNMSKLSPFIVQRYIPHGGIMVKNYYLNHKAYSYIRPSLPDMKGETLKMKQLESGAFTFYNEFIYKKEDPTFFAYSDQSAEDTLKKKINFDAINQLSHLFVKITGITFFGLDYLYEESTDTYFLLEVNYFPSYRELGSALASEFAEHLIKFNDLYKK